jgi:hypothetical protein
MQLMVKLIIDKHGSISWPAVNIWFGRHQISSKQQPKEEAEIKPTSNPHQMELSARVNEITPMLHCQQLEPAQSNSHLFRFYSGPTKQIARIRPSFH